MKSNAWRIIKLSLMTNIGYLLVGVIYLGLIYYLNDNIEPTAGVRRYYTETEIPDLSGYTPVQGNYRLEWMKAGILLLERMKVAIFLILFLYFVAVIHTANNYRIGIKTKTNLILFTGLKLLIAFTIGALVLNEMFIGGGNPIAIYGLAILLGIGMVFLSEVINTYLIDRLMKK